MSFTRSGPQIEREPTGEIVGLDMGVTHTVATSKDKFLDMKLLTNRERQPKDQRKNNFQVLSACLSSLSRRWE
ncbi:hypothetical protein [Ferrimicrobium acidiphilum]|uniref:hypothetical protein n=1 Tax=Ferrimicrobium acidiphilum TaxID=121039 RepID=UPI0023F324C5|nr:hypothetical protein [Ferrimicrobium acidiphilum]